jgi:hypothetical protein
MNVNNIGTLGIENSGKALARLGGPDHLRSDGETVQEVSFLQIHVAAHERNYRMTVPLKQAFLAFKNDVFAAQLPIGVVNHYDFHGLPWVVELELRGFTERPTPVRFA